MSFYEIRIHTIRIVIVPRGAFSIFFLSLDDNRLRLTLKGTFLSFLESDMVVMQHSGISVPPSELVLLKSAD